MSILLNLAVQNLIITHHYFLMTLHVFNTTCKLYFKYCTLQQVPSVEHFFLLILPFCHTTAPTHSLIPLHLKYYFTLNTHNHPIFLTCT